MRTPLSDFSQRFRAALRLVLAPLEEVLGTLRQGLDEELERELGPQLERLRGELELLRQRVEEQQAYLVIFGPLKSGKSTLMNALAGAFVSEVTSLPAYPAVVFVAHSPQPSYRITRFDGQSETLADTAELHAMIAEAHGSLARAVRSADASGSVLDLARDLPKAIRRIDVAVPAGDLAPAEVVLVDTPGLYTRMRIDYDAMTRDLKRSASVAVFVVKADSLFLEQVFAELSELSALYSRIFLVLNVDSRGMDLGPEGELVPSLEQSAPERIVRAFEELSMNARLKQAVDAGRLGIYPVDLLRAASTRLRERAGGEPGGAPDFELFRADLTQFLEGNDYLNAFVSDGLTRAGMLLDELDGVSSQPPVRHFVERLQRLVDQRDRHQGLLDDARALSSCAWKSEFDAGPRGVLDGARRRNEIVAEVAGARLDEALADWFASSASLQELIESTLVSMAQQTRARLRGAFLGDLRARVAADGAGLGLRDELRGRARRIGLDLGALGREVLRELEQGLPDVDEQRWPLTPDQVPVRRRLADWLLLRSRSSVRQRLLGPDEAPGHSIEPARKARRLGRRAREAMAAAIRAHHDQLVAAEVEALDRDVRDVFTSTLDERATEAVQTRIEDIVPRVGDLVSGVERLRAGLLELEGLRSELSAARWALQEIRATCAPRLREVELRPAPRPSAAASEGLPGERTAAQRGTP